MVVHPLEKRIGAAVNPLTIKELREELKLKYIKLNGGKYGGKGKSEEEGEVGLFAGGFKGRCHNCGKQGHRAKECKEPKKDGKPRKEDKKDE